MKYYNILYLKRLGDKNLKSGGSIFKVMRHWKFYHRPEIINTFQRWVKKKLSARTRQVLDY